MIRRAAFRLCLPEPARRTTSPVPSTVAILAGTLIWSYGLELGLVGGICG
jgi:hypothetical protein